MVANKYTYWQKVKQNKTSKQPLTILCCRTTFQKSCQKSFFILQVSDTNI